MEFGCGHGFLSPALHHKGSNSFVNWDIIESLYITDIWNVIELLFLNNITTVRL